MGHKQGHKRIHKRGLSTHSVFTIRFRPPDHKDHVVSRFCVGFKVHVLSVCVGFCHLLGRVVAVESCQFARGSSSHGRLFIAWSLGIVAVEYSLFAYIFLCGVKRERFYRDKFFGIKMEGRLGGCPRDVPIGKRQSRLTARFESVTCVDWDVNLKWKLEVTIEGHNLSQKNDKLIETVESRNLIHVMGL